MVGAGISGICYIFSHPLHILETYSSADAFGHHGAPCCGVYPWVWCTSAWCTSVVEFWIFYITACRASQAFYRSLLVCVVFFKGVKSFGCFFSAHEYGCGVDNFGARPWDFYHHHVYSNIYVLFVGGCDLAVCCDCSCCTGRYYHSCSIAAISHESCVNFFNPEADPQGTSYQIRQVLLSLGSGGWTGVGLGKSRQKYEYLPEANTDSIFAILGEETGFIGGVFVIGLLQLMLWRGFYIARSTTDPYGRMLVLGVVSWVGMQSLINLGSMVALVPLTGVPLPLISYGGSNLVITLGALGIVHNVSKHI